ncbi:MAG: Gfo/Idh/MocA family oxidoreductase [Chloroflexota bacterium]|nr:MAG: Gfo/Idh/MocA family oxidoreductase [Chloroflexota bacterium]
MSRKVRIGVLGAGDVAQHTYIPGIARQSATGTLEFVALCDMVPGRAESLAQRYGVPRHYTKFEDLLADDAVDAIVNLTPPTFHAEAITRGLAAGKHVYSEKTIATTIEDADRVIAAAQSAGLVLAVAPALMTHPDMREVRDLIRGGLIGKVCYVRARGSHPGPAWLLDYRTDPTWFYQPGAGPVVDLAIYPLTYVTAFLGAAKRVFAFSGIAIPERDVRAGEARGKTIKVGVDDNTQLMLDFGDSCFAHIDATFVVFSSKGPRCEIAGSKGVINLAAEPDEPPYEVFLDNPEHGIRGWLTPEKVYRGRLNPPREPRGGVDWSLASGVEHFARVIAGEEELLLRPEHARHVLEIILKGYESAREGRALDLTTTYRSRRRALRRGLGS